MPTEVSSTLAEAQIRGLIDGWVNAVRTPGPRRDHGELRKRCPGLRRCFRLCAIAETDAYRKNWQECFDMMQGADRLRDP